MSWNYLARAYLDLQHLRVAVEARIRKLEENTPETIKTIMYDYHSSLKMEEKQLLKNITGQLKEHALWGWCKRVKGMGPVAALTFLGFIDPRKADTAGKAKAYVGAVPKKKLESGVRMNINPEAKGRMWLVTRNVIMAKDDYYYPLYQTKKQYYLKTQRQIGDVAWPPFSKILADPSTCPRYAECLARLRGKAKRLKRESKKLPCKLHLDQMSKRWLMGLLVSHATELMRDAEGLPTELFKAHRNYIRPK